MLLCNQIIVLSEGEITNEIKNFLIKKEWSIIQYSPPGGSLGNPYKLNNENIYIDIVAVKNQIAVIFENKSVFNKSDINKLNDIRNDTEVLRKINYFSSKKKQNKVSKLIFFHGHNKKFEGKIYNDINLFFIDNNYKIKTDFDNLCIIK